MKRKIAFYGNNSRLGKFLIEKWCIKNHNKYKLFLIFDDKTDSDGFNNIPFAEKIIISNKDLINALLNKNIKDIFILEASELLAVSYQKNRFIENNITVYVENTNFLKTHFDKYLSNLCLAENNLPIPKFQLLSEFVLKPKLNFPIIIKPTRGYASKGIKVFNTKKEYYENFDKDLNLENFIVQEFLKGTEYSCTIVNNGNNLVHMSIKREKIKEYTISSKFKQEYNNHIKQWIPNIRSLGFQYAINIQYIITDNILKIIELNPRLGTAETHRFEYSFDTIDLLLGPIDKSYNFKDGSFIIKI